MKDTLEVSNSEDPMYTTWTVEETRELLKIRAVAEMDKDILIWNSVASKLKLMGYDHNPMECRTKWIHSLNLFQKMVKDDPNHPIHKKYLLWNETKFNCEKRMLNRLVPIAKEGEANGCKRKALSLASDSGHQLSLQGKKLKDCNYSNFENGGSSTNGILASMLGKIEETNKKIEKAKASVLGLLHKIDEMNTKSAMRDGCIKDSLLEISDMNKKAKERDGQIEAMLAKKEARVAEPSTGAIHFTNFF